MNHRETQAKRILKLLESYAPNEVSLVEILDLHIAQYNSRIKDLRDAGYRIENRREVGNDGITRSWYKLLP